MDYVNAHNICYSLSRCKGDDTIPTEDVIDLAQVCLYLLEQVHHLETLCPGKK